LQRIVSFCRGFANGLTAPVDSRTMRFIHTPGMTATQP
jgi:hypothetical protein